jgi:ABC-type nitrate/sulfonate/bicarbonate transport system substrate-binding protein
MWLRLQGGGHVGLVVPREGLLGFWLCRQLRKRSTNVQENLAMTQIGRRDVLGGMAAVGLAALNLGLNVPSARAAEPVTLRLGYGGAAEEQIWLLIAKPDIGKYQGTVYTLDATRFRGSDERAQAFAAGAIDLSEGSATGVMSAAAEGVNSKIIASITRESKKGFSTAFYVQATSPIKSIADMRGKNVGVNGFQTAGHLWLKAALEKNGMTDSDVTITPVPFPAMESALTSGKIDVGEFPQPFAALLEHDAQVTKLFDAKYGVPFDEELIVIAGKDEFLKKNAEAIRAFLADVKTSTDFYLAHPAEARQILIDKKMVRVSPDVYLTMNDYYRDPTLKPNVESLKKMQEFQMKAGFQTKPADVDSLVDTSYLPQ